MRIADELKAELDAAWRIPPKTNMSEIVRICIEPYLKFTKETGRRPIDFPELAKWCLEKK